jgi:uncharacterized protein (TIGR03435 family)
MQKWAINCLIVAAGILCLPHSPAQTPSEKLPQFEVATVKPIDTSPGVMHMVGTSVTQGGRVKITTFSLKELVCVAYGFGYWQISGGEDWTDKTRYDIEAVAPQTDPPTAYNVRHSNRGIEDPQLKKMLQALLMERFALKYHVSSTSGTVYLLEKSGKPTPLVASTEKYAKNYGEGFSGDVGFAGNRWGIYNTSMPQLATFASQFLKKQVTDRTGLDGAFDYRWTVADANERATGEEFMNTYNQTFPLFLDAMGLKLTKSTGEVQSFVIDHAEPPSPN